VIITLVHYLFQLLWWIVLADVILSWVLAVQRPRWAYHPAVRLVQEIAFQILRPFRRLLDRLGLRTGPIDFSPMVAILALQVIEIFVIRLLIMIGVR
jgi:YggT family protein